MLFLCRWPNGDLSIVSGRSLEEIDDVLDEVGDGHAAELTRITGRFGIHLTFEPDAGETGGVSQFLKLDSFDERSDDRLGDAYPHLHKALHSLWELEHCGEDAADETVAAARAEVKQAIESEREREMDPKKLKVLDGHCCYFGAGDAVTDKQKDALGHDSPKTKKAVEGGGQP